LDDHGELGPIITRAGTAGDSLRFITGLPADTDAKTGERNSHQGLHFKALAADKGGRHMEPFIVDIASDAEQEKSTHEGEEFIYVLSGRITLDYGKDTFTLNEGDSVYYDSIIPHRLLSAEKAAARILAVLYTPV
jgi:quercetin dioxygenase-like cupin family protein